MRRHVHTVRVRYHECDQQGHVFNAHYLAFFDMAITELLRDAIGGYMQMVQRGVDIVVGEAHVRYLGAARFDDVLDIEVEVADLGTTSMRSEYAVRRGEDVVTTGWARHVFVDTPAMTKRPIPEDIREALEGEPARGPASGGHAAASGTP
jgi:acyl-CoA thioester hydrolase